VQRVLFYTLFKTLFKNDTPDPSIFSYLSNQEIILLVEYLKNTEISRKEKLLDWATVSIYSNMLICFCKKLHKHAVYSQYFTYRYEKLPMLLNFLRKVVVVVVVVLVLFVYKRTSDRAESWHQQNIRDRL
jgi:hypothetical protein